MSEINTTGRCGIGTEFSQDISAIHNAATKRAAAFHRSVTAQTDRIWEDHLAECASCREYEAHLHTAVGAKESVTVEVRG
jgi:hypothetical protein